ncbi:isoflavone reductase homolog IRL-like [Triticum urartu]|uniref:NmrA-like domain-containing protein n=1 Tax=Triticum urartu TaxID=4572 RepID=A0A8R7TPV0_TRIUA|nr:isoflavone reductase homolog IRL-like [Triticum urartu]XP_048561142.1 isoflavone reductase homolog IRL-like [Triticum urartu]XP_048561143.1 isoflavone reductase homolog IRL-like [Triticum urartu]
MLLDKEEERSRVLVIGGTGHIGKHIVAASVRRGHPTSVLIRDAAPADLAKAQLLKSFIDSGVALIKGDLFDHGSLVNAIKGADVVISAVGTPQLDEQTRIVMAIKEAGNVIKRFLPSEFGSDPERVHTVDPAATLYAGKIRLRRLIEAEGIPHTYVCCNGFAETYLLSIGDVTAVGAAPPSSDKITVLGDGDAKGVFVVEEDIASYTVRAIDDTRTLNKILYMRPPANIVSHNELIALWEKKAGRTFQIARIPEADLLKLIKEAAYPLNMMLSHSLSVFVRGDQANFDIEASFGVEATELYPDVKYTTVDEYLDRLL